MLQLLEALETTADGVMVVDENLEIIYRNKAAQAILGFEKRDVSGHACYQVLHGYDEKRQLMCTANCRVAQMALSGRPIRHFDIHCQTKLGEKRWLNMSLFTYTGHREGRTLMVHLFRDINQKKHDEAFLRSVLELAKKYQNVQPETEPAKEADSPSEGLTFREREVLALLAKGHTTREIAQRLVISPNTVRNHIQQILHKLQVHTRLEAVAHALKHGLVD
jgi:PAS domain S-box-containing protein